MMPLFFLLLWWLMWVYPWRLPLYRSHAILCVLLSLLIVYTGIGTLEVYYDERYPVMHLQKDCLVYIGPDVTYTTHESLQQGDKVRVLEIYQQWRKVSKDTITGWIQADGVTPEKD